MQSTGNELGREYVIFLSREDLYCVLLNLGRSPLYIVVRESSHVHKTPIILNIERMAYTLIVISLNHSFKAINR